MSCTARLFDSTASMFGDSIAKKSNRKVALSSCLPIAPVVTIALFNMHRTRSSANGSSWAVGDGGRALRPTAVVLDPSVTTTRPAKPLVRRRDALSVYRFSDST